MKAIRKHIRWIVVGAAVFLAGGGYAGYHYVVQAQTASTESPLQTASVQTGSIVISASGSGSLISNSEWQLGFNGDGTLIELDAGVGDEVKAGQVLGKIDDTNAQQKLQQAQLNLAALTGPEALASAQQGLANAQTALTSAQYSLSVAQQGNRASAQTIAAQEGKVLLAKQALDDARRRWSGGTPDDHDSAQGAINLNNAQLAYDSAVRTLNWYKGKPTAAEQAKLQAAVDLARAQVDSAQALVDTLTGASTELNSPAVPVNADLLKLRQAQLDVQTAQTGVDETVITSPIDGTVLSVDATVGQTVSGSSVITVADLSHPSLKVNFDETDLAQVQIGNPVNVTFEFVSRPDLHRDDHPGRAAAGDRRGGADRPGTGGARRGCQSIGVGGIDAFGSPVPVERQPDIRRPVGQRHARLGGRQLAAALPGPQRNRPSDQRPGQKCPAGPD